MKNLDSYIKTIRKAESATPLVSTNELRSLVDSIVSGSVQTPPAVSSFFTASRIGTMASVIGALAIGTFAWFASGNSTDVSSAQKETAPNVRVNEQQKQQNLVEERFAHLRVASASPVLSTQQQNSNQATPLVFIQATSEELHALGIQQQGTTFSAMIEELFVEKESPVQAKVLLKSLGYPMVSEHTILRATATIKPNTSTTEPIKYDGWNTEIPKGFSPYACVFYSMGKDGGLSVTSSTVDHSPYIQSPDVQRELLREFNVMHEDLAKAMDDSFGSKAFALQTKPYKYASYLVAIGVDVSNETGKHMAVFFYVPTQEFLKALQPEHRNVGVAIQQVAMSKQCAIPYSGTTTVVEEKPVPVPSTISGIQYVELTPEELKAIGVLVENNEIRFSTEQMVVAPTANGTEEKDLRKYKKQLEAYESRKKELLETWNYKNADSILARRSVHAQFGKNEPMKYIPYAGWDYTTYNKISPVGFSIEQVRFNYNPEYGVCTPSVNNSRSMHNTPLLKESQIASITTTAPNGNVVHVGASTIPVRIRLGSVQDALENSCYPKQGVDSSTFKMMQAELYFVANAEFVAALPDRYRIPLQHELQLLEKVRKGEIIPQEACATLKNNNEQSLLGWCSASQGTIQKLQVFPNPASASATCSFVATEQGSYSVAIYTLQGTLVKALLQTSFTQGSNSVTLPLKEIPTGVYLLSITSTNGVQATQRIIIQ